ncbi:NACHT domain-containing protein [Streptosporangium sp. NPDC000509]|uniref:NACHT domain-containing protein n=1 Tax=Streptosporangium sp. NPDC000509 TaxID=3366186 RepID=UPI0036A4D044
MSGRVLKWAGIIVFIGTVSAMGFYLLTRDKLEEADQSASVIGVFIALSSLALTLYGMLTDRFARSPSTQTSPEETIAAAKKTLTGLVFQQWRTEAAIRSLDDPEPIRISWHLVTDAGVMDHPRLVGENLLMFSGSSDQIPKLVHAFQGLRRRRLVITGGPGSGKTTLAIQLLLHLVAPGRDAADPVPVLVPVNGWDIDLHPRLHDWLAMRLPLDYPALTAPQFGTGAAKTLLDHGHILPILDGLDEIPPQARIAVISALNRWLASGDQFILTSRTTEYDQAVRQAGDVLTATAVIAPAAITPDAAETYLRTTLPPTPRHDWAPIWAALHDGSCPGLSRLAETALGLWLIRTVYIITAADPVPLTGPLAQQDATLRAHLLDHLVVAVINDRLPSRDPADHFRPRIAWNPDRARDHLTYLARVLQDHDTYDLAWWHLAQHTIPHSERRRVTWRVGLLSGIAVGLVVGVAGGIVEGIAAGLGFGIAAVFAGGTWFSEPPGYANLYLPGRTADLIKHMRNVLAGGIGGVLAVVLGVVFAVVLLVVLADGLTVGLTVGLMVALAAVFAAVFAAGAMEWAEQPASSTVATTPLTSWKADRTLTLLRTVTFGLPFGLAGGLAGGIADGLTVGIAIGIAVGIAFGIAKGNHHAWLAYTIAVWRLAKKKHLPRKLMAFLDDAHRLGLLRTVGPIYQFRHAELQDHLAALPHR